MTGDVDNPFAPILEGGKELARGIHKRTGPLPSLPQDERSAFDRYSANKKGPTLSISCYDASVGSRWVEMFYPLSRGAQGYAPIIGQVTIEIDPETNDLVVEEDPTFWTAGEIGRVFAEYGLDVLEIAAPVVRQMAKLAHYTGSGKKHKAGADGLEESMVEEMSRSIAALQLQDRLLTDARRSRPEFYY